MVTIRKVPMPPVASSSARSLTRRGRAAIAGAAPMELALQAARRAGACGEVPVGAVVTDGAGAVLSVQENRMRRAGSACAHAEMLAMAEAAGRRPDTATPGRLEGCDLWVTLEPCAMCAAAAGLFRIRRILFAAYDPKGGGTEHGPRAYGNDTIPNRQEVIGGIREREAKIMLQDFFRDLREVMHLK